MPSCDNEEIELRFGFQIGEPTIAGVAGGGVGIVVGVRFWCRCRG